MNSATRNEGDARRRDSAMPPAGAESWRPEGLVSAGRVAAGPRRQAAGGVDALGDRDLLVLGGQVGPWRVVAAPVAQPGTAVELQAAVVPVAGVDRPVAARLA